MKPRAKLFLITLFAGVIAFAIWFVRRPDNVDFFHLAPPRWLEIDGIRVHYIQEGTGPDILLIHGFAASTFAWREVFQPLSKEYRVTAFDWPGFGLSDKGRQNSYDLDNQAKRLGGLIQMLGLEPARIVAWSMGGEISMWLAKTQPELVSRLLLVAPATNPKIVPVPIALADWTAPYLASWFITPQLVTMTARRVFHQREFVVNGEEKDFSFLVQQLYFPFHNSTDAYYSVIEAFKLISDPRIPGELAGLTQPIRVLYGTDDKIVPKWTIENFLKIVPSAEYVEFPEGSHGLMIDEPLWFMDQVRGFFKENPSGQ